MVLMEEEVFVRCLEQDQALVQSVIAQCEKDFADEVKRQLGEEKTVKITIDTANSMKLRKVHDFSDVDIKAISDEHEK
jgi:hypothetical protein